MAEKFDLAAALAPVSKLDTGAAQGREQMQYIDIDLMDDDPTNFYDLSGIEELAANIELMGLLQPVRLRPAEKGRYTIEAGHRRRAALRLLVDAGKTEFREAASIVETGGSSPAMQELRLIFANADTREISSAEQAQQAERVEELLYRLKEEGVEFPGRMRDHVAQACKLSKTKLANLKVIREKLIPEYMEEFTQKKDPLNLSTALELARLPEEWQRKIYAVDPTPYSAVRVQNYAEVLRIPRTLVCQGCGDCKNADAMWAAYTDPHSHGYMPCHHGKGQCCLTCSVRFDCKAACPECADEVKTAKAEKRAVRKVEIAAEKQAAEEEKNHVAALWSRFGKARGDADVTVEQAYKMLGRYWSKDYTDKEVYQKEDGEFDFKSSTASPYSGSDPKQIASLAAEFGCSVDYLFCRTDAPCLPGSGSEALAEGVWHRVTETPRIGCKVTALIVADGVVAPCRLCYQFGDFRFFNGDSLVKGTKVVAWMEEPEWPEWVKTPEEAQDGD